MKMGDTGGVPWETWHEREERAAAGAPLLVLDQRLVMRRLFQATWVLIAAGAAVVCLRGFLDRDWLLGLAPRFDMDMEGNVPTWFSTMLLGACSLAAAAAARVQPRDIDRGPVRRLFNGLAVIFLWLSIDEAASFHEVVQEPLRDVLNAGGFLFFAWVIPGMVFALLVAVWSIRGLRLLPSGTRQAMLRAGTVYCAGALGVEMIAGKYVSLAGRIHWDWVYGLLTVGEETLEMLGVLLCLRAVLQYLSAVPHSAMVVIGEAPDRVYARGLQSCAQEGGVDRRGDPDSEQVLVTPGFSL